MRYNPPPNWPAPPPGWAPTAGWQPDPSWGPPPAGWPLWIPEPGDGRRPNANAWGRVGVVAAGAYVVVLVLQAALGVFSAYNVGAALGPVLLAYVGVSLIVFFARTRWHWLAVVGTYLGIWLALGLVGLMGQVGRGGI